VATLRLSLSVGICFLGTLYAQRFPSAIATDSDIYVAANRAETQLSSVINNSTLTIPVVSTTAFVVNTIITIEDERLRICAIGSGTFTACGRGFGGTVAVSHLSGRPVRGQVTAEYHNAVAAEVKAIEQTLGANLQNVFLLRSDLYNFTAQSPGGSLAVGSNTITMAPVPRGVNGSDVGHSLYVSGGVGTAEACLITGGAAVSGASSGTVTMNCANTHSGAWTVASATAGIQEAYQASGGSYTGVKIPAGQHTIHAPITIRGSAGFSLRGDGQLATRLNSDVASGCGINLPAYNETLTISDFSIYGPSSGSAYAVCSVEQAHLKAYRLGIYNFPGGVSVSGTATNFNTSWSDMIIWGFSGNGLYVDTPADAGTWSKIMFIGDGLATSKAVYLKRVVGMNIRDSYAYQVGYGLFISPVSATSVGSIIADNYYVDGYNPNVQTGYHIEGAGNIFNLQFSNCNVWGMSVGIHVNSSTADGISFANCTLGGNANAGIALNAGKNIILNGVNAVGNNTSAFGQPGLLINAVSNVQITGGIYGQAYNQANSQAYGIYFLGTSSNVVVQGAIVTPNVTTGIGGAFTGIGTTIRDVIGYNPQGIHSITVGASPYTYTAGASAETVYITGGTVSSIKRGSTTVAPSTPAAVTLAPNTALIVTYSVAPTMVADVQ
jgi:hypothetical protein